VQHAVRDTQSALGQSKGGIAGDEHAALDDHAVATWQVVREKLRAEFGATAYRYWLEPVGLIAVEAGVARLGAPTRAMRDWVTQHYLDRIQKFWHSEDPDVHFVEINIVSAAAAQAGSAPSTSKNSAAADASASGSRAKSARNNESRENVVASPCQPARSGRTAIASMSDDGISAALDPRYTFDNFVLGKPNEFA